MYCLINSLSLNTRLGSYYVIIIVPRIYQKVYYIDREHKKGSIILIQMYIKGL